MWNKTGGMRLNSLKFIITYAQRSQIAYSLTQGIDLTKPREIPIQMNI